MKNGLFIKSGIIIPENELEVSTSRSGGPGGQHVNKTNTRITLRWNVKTSQALTEEQRQRVLQNMQALLTLDGDLIIHNSEGRSQIQNKKAALEQLAQKIRKALFVPKKRKPTRISKSTKEAHLKIKAHKSEIKKLRGKISYD